jgi:hypothetical protein
LMTDEGEAWCAGVGLLTYGWMERCWDVCICFFSVSPPFYATSPHYSFNCFPFLMLDFH